MIRAKMAGNSRTPSNGLLDAARKLAKARAERLRNAASNTHVHWYRASAIWPLFGRN